MKTSAIHKSWFSSFFVALILLVSCNNKESNSGIETTDTVAVYHYADTVTIAPAVVSRESITFILGEDKSAENPYYSEATKYFSGPSHEKTDHLVTHCRSLVEVREYLTKNAPANSLPWGRINLVSHGDQYLGLSVKVAPGSRRTTLERLQEYIDAGSFSPLAGNIVDENTEIALHACGIGNNKAFVEAFGMVFKSENALPHVIAPKLFEMYSSASRVTGGKESNRFQTRVWMVPYNKEDKPGEITLCNLLHEEYPNATIDWQDALTRRQPRFAGDTYHYTFEIPVNMVINLLPNDTLPDFSTADKRLQWIDQQPEINHILSKIQIPAELFSWNLKKGFAKSKDGKKAIAISVKGSCTMLCILKPLVDETAALCSKPFVPAISDTTYYYTVRGKNFNIKS